MIPLKFYSTDLKALIGNSLSFDQFKAQGGDKMESRRQARICYQFNSLFL